MPLQHAEAQRRAGQDFFERARQGLTLDVPAALTDLTAPAMRGDLDLDPETWKKAGVTAFATRRRADARGRRAGAVGDPDAAHH